MQHFTPTNGKANGKEPTKLGCSRRAEGLGASAHMFHSKSLTNIYRERHEIGLFLLCVLCNNFAYFAVKFSFFLTAKSAKECVGDAKKNERIKNILNPFLA